MILLVFHSSFCFHSWRDIAVPAQYLVGSSFLLSLIISDSKDRALRINTDCLCVCECVCVLVVCLNKILNFYFVSTESTHQIRKAHILFLHLVYNLIAQGCDGLNFCFLLGIKEKYILCFFFLETNEVWRCSNKVLLCGRYSFNCLQK